MLSNNPSQSPAGVGGYTETKPAFSQQQQQIYNADPYGNQSAFAAKQGYTDTPLSPAPQYNATAPYNPPVSPPPQQDHYGHDVKYAYSAPLPTGAAELGGTTSSTAPAPTVSPGPQAAELGGESRQGGTAPSELPSSSR